MANLSIHTPGREAAQEDLSSLSEDEARSLTDYATFSDRPIARYAEPPHHAWRRNQWIGANLECGT